MLAEGVKTNIHYVLAETSIEEAVYRLENDAFPDGVNAVIFLLYKPVGLGKIEKILTIGHPLLKKFFGLVDRGVFSFKLGFDSCTVPAIINYNTNIDRRGIDTCEGGRFSSYITPDMKMLPCSFDHEKKWAFDISEKSIREGWESEQFEHFLYYMKNSCPYCEERELCFGGCPIKREIVLCNREEKVFYEN